MPYLEVQTRNGSKRVRLNLTEGKPFTIGRLKQCDLVLRNDVQVSREHCAISRELDGIVLKDLGSSNGTVMNNIEITRELLSNGMVFYVGNTRLRYVEADDQSLDARQRPDAGDSLSGQSRMGASSTHMNPPAQQPRSAPPATQSTSPGLSQQTSKPSPPQPVASAPVSAPAAASKNVDNFSDDDLFNLEFTPGPDSKTKGPNITGNRGITGIDSLSTIGQDIGYDIDDLTLYNTRGDIVHNAQGGQQGAVSEALRMLRLIIVGCIRSGASDVHVEPKSGLGVLRLRIDGTMVEVCRFSNDDLKRLSSLIKVLCDIDPSQKSIVQEGHFSADVPGRRVDYRVSFTPSMHGQKLVIRVLDPVNAPQQIKDLHLPGWMGQSIARISRQDTGLLIVCGPTGSGKTTTLYATLREIDNSVRNVITIEDPVEYEMDGVTQMPVDPAQGQTFAALLRSVLRQDPDVILLGEIRDAETATAALQAASTGHLVLSTVHAKDTVGTIFRLLDLGVEPYLLASTLNLVLAQRLLRTLCPHCKEPRRATPQEVIWLKRTAEGVPHLYKPVGCPKCFGTGYAGRRGVYELLTTNDAMRDIIMTDPNIAGIKKALENTMFQSLKETAGQMVLDSITSLSEVERSIGLD